MFYDMFANEQRGAHDKQGDSAAEEEQKENAKPTRVGSLSPPKEKEEPTSKSKPAKKGMTKYSVYRMFTAMLQFFGSTDDDADGGCVQDFTGVFAELDDDHNGVISLEELYAHVSRNRRLLAFLGSAVLRLGEGSGARRGIGRTGSGVGFAAALRQTTRLDVQNADGARKTRSDPSRTGSKEKMEYARPWMQTAKAAAHLVGIAHDLTLHLKSPPVGHTGQKRRGLSFERSTSGEASPSGSPLARGALPPIGGAELSIDSPLTWQWKQTQKA